ncbi:MAG TPA: efflux RND transporter permease subunit [Burkholderiaceae bacterium]|jgi:HAE1 family hydrophobic/amphiphilic exporter-1
MFISDFAIKKPLATVVFIISIMALGLLALSKLKVNQNPDVQIPILVVVVPYPGASPETSEREIVNRLERPLQAVAGVTEVQANAQEGQAVFVMKFDFKKNLIEATDDVRNAIAQVRYYLPQEMREPIVQRVDPSADPIMQLSLESTRLSHAELSRIAEDDLADKFRSVSGVGNVDIYGSLNRELSVLLSGQKLREFNISVTDVVNALRNQNMSAPVGKLRGDYEDQSIRLIGRVPTPEEFNNIVVRKSSSGELVRLGQVAHIEDGFAERARLSVRNTRPNVGINITRSREASTVSVAKEVRKIVEEARKTLPQGTTLDIIDDGGEHAQDSLDNVVDALALGAGLTIFVVYVFLNSWRSTLITATSLPTSVIAAFIAVWLCGFTLNFMSLLGLSLAIGVLIDDAIVVRENIVRHMERGADRRTAAFKGTAEIGLAVAATTFSIVAVFVPVAFIPGIAGEWFRPFALTVVASVLVSLLISFTLDPMLSAFWGDPPGHHEAPKTGISLQLQKFNHWFDHMADRYGQVIAWALHHRVIMGVIAALSLVAAIALQVTFGGTEFVPKSDFGVIAVDIRTPPSSSLEYARKKFAAAEAIARQIPEVKSTDSGISNTGGKIWIGLGKSTERKRNAQEISTDLRERLRVLTGAEYVVLDDVNNGAQKPVQISFYGTDTRTLMSMTEDYMERLRKVRGAVDVGLSRQDTQDEIQIELHRGLANVMGISVGDAANALRVAFAGLQVGDWIDPTGKTRDVSVRLQPSDRVDAANIERLPISVAGTGQMVPLGQIATITTGKGPAGIQHLDGKRTVGVSANVQGRAAGEVSADALKLAKSMSFPPGYGIKLGGASKDQQEVFGSLGLGLVAGICLMYLVLVIQFNSFTAPLAVMLSQPLSLIGVVAALLITHGTLNLMSLIGIVMLAGLVAKNAILLLDAARAEERAGVPREEALMHAGRKRFRPILMTTFALIAGMMPVAIGMGEGGEFYRPMAVAIIGGTITSTFLTLLMVPSFYDSIEIARDRMFAKFGRRAERWTAFPAFIVTFFEALLTIVLLRFVYRWTLKPLLVRAFGWERGQPPAANEVV